ncbi:hypothetical protein [Sporosarcina highlanderae]|uniref:Uncharacterized protein n=1 Tax=Sporosarcina highlanderae TaxID=3035916 RepID=A0ABT8JVD6_9BACL|nr:hypothetical protein [Sporosarcina highlanderae]MDN4609143.1 hypothetical protein [Sporosarcina highlanderae]
MTINYADDYAAEKLLRALSKTDKEKLRANRKRKQKERLAIMARLDVLEEQRFDKCNKQDVNTIQCDCSAAQAIRTLGERLLKLSDGKPERIIKKTPNVKGTLTVDEYNAMKAKGMIDKDIMKKIRWSTVRFYDWKKEMGLTTRPSTVPERESHDGKPLKGMTLADYQARKNKKHSDALIAADLRIGSHRLQQWKRDNGLTKPLQDAEQPKENKEGKSMSNAQNASTIDYKAKYKSVKSKFETAVKDFGSYQDKHREEIGRKDDEITRLENKVAELEESLVASDAVSEITALQVENNRLKNYEADYRNLEIDYRNLNSENERLKRMLSRLKNTERMNLWMMEQYVGLHKQVDEVMA